MGDDGGGAGESVLDEELVLTGTEMRLGRICLLQTGHQVVSKVISMVYVGWT